MKTQWIESANGVRIAYDVSGSGPALMLLHGAGKDRADWHKLGYVKRLQEDFTVINVDLRGSGESDFLAEIADYEITKILTDLYAVADACQASHFAVWGYSLGGNIARYLGAWSGRITAAALVGVPFGPAVNAEFDRFIDEFTAKWGATAENYRTGNLAAGKRQAAIKGRIPVWVACFQAMRNWPAIAPGEMKCPTLLLAGSKNKAALPWVQEHASTLENTHVQVHLVEGLTHPQEFSQVALVFPQVHAFLAGSARE
ncbi:MAG: alpha/beta fold hydrolase [Chloroflexota bacterium]